MLTPAQRRVLQACEASLTKGRCCQLELTSTVVQTQEFTQWLIHLYQQYPAQELATQLRFIDNHQPEIRNQLMRQLPFAALIGQLSREQKDSFCSELSQR